VHVLRVGLGVFPELSSCSVRVVTRIPRFLLCLYTHGSIIAPPAQLLHHQHFKMYVTNAPEPPTELGRYRCLAPKAGVMVSPLQLGGLNFGDAW
jgi:hypothetical protein